MNYVSRETFFKKTLFFIETLQYNSGLEHYHEFFELGYVMQGEGINVVNGKEAYVKKGDYYILDPAAIHNIHKVGHEDFVIVNCLFVPELIDNTLKDANKLEVLLNNYLIKIDCDYFYTPPHQLIFHDNDGIILSCINRLHDEFKMQDFGCNEVVRALLVQIIMLTMRTYFKEEPSCPQSLSQQIIQSLKETTGEDICLQHFSNKFHYSISYISKKFKEETGHTFISHVQKLRIEQSCRLLINTDYQIATIAEKVGYNDLSFFHKLFKSSMNCSPKLYRNRYKQNVEI